MKIAKIIFIIIAIICVLPTKSYTKQLSGRGRISFDNIKVDSSNDMGLLGVHYDVKNINTIMPNLYAGIGGYGGITGDHGGFFTGGISIGYHKLLDLSFLPGKNWAIDTGFFAGGGGGAGAFPGGGTMLRSHLVMEKHFSQNSLRFGISQTNFPNSSNQNQKDTHYTIGLSVPMGKTKNKTDNKKEKTNYSTSQIAPAILFYQPKSSTIRGTNTSIDSDITLLGFQYHKHYLSHYYTSFELYGAGNGGTDGYAKVLAGAGYQLPLNDNLSIDTKLLFGMAGGGGVDTGGGFIIQPMLGMNIHLSKKWILKPAAGYTYAPDGNFQSKTLQLSLSHNLANDNKQNNPKAKIDNPTTTEFSLAHKTYFPSSDAKTKSNGEYHDQIHQLGIILAKPVSKYIKITGSAFGAYKGGVGAYAEGLFGIELSFKPIIIAYNFGVAGGGGMDVGDGFIHQLTMGYNQKLTRNISLKAEIGKTKPLEGTFEATTIQFTINKSF